MSPLALAAASGAETVHGSSLRPSPSTVVLLVLVGLLWAALQVLWARLEAVLRQSKLNHEYHQRERAQRQAHRREDLREMLQERRAAWRAARRAERRARRAARPRRQWSWWRR